MASDTNIAIQVAVSFGNALSGLAADVRYSFINPGNNVLLPATNEGVYEIADAEGNPTTGLYIATATINSTWLPCSVIWTIEGQVGVATIETLGTLLAPYALEAILTEHGENIRQLFSLLHTQLHTGTTSGPSLGQAGTALVLEGETLRMSVPVTSDGYRSEPPTIFPPA